MADHCQRCGGQFTELDPRHPTGVDLHRACYGIVMGDWSMPKRAEPADLPGQRGTHPVQLAPRS